MDNVTPPLVIPKSCAIRLNQIQFEAFQHSLLEIRSPKNKFLTRIGVNLPNMSPDEVMFQLWYQACCLEALFDRIENNVQLPQKTFSSIITVIDRIDVHIRKQMEG